MSRRTGAWASVFVVTVACYPLSCFAETTATYTWMLPKTVLDVSVVYSYAKCTVRDNNQIVGFKITPTVTARGVPDRLQHLRSVQTSDLNAAWEDRNISLSTFANTHILNSVGASPANQTTTIIGNVLGGITKLVGIGLGVASPALAEFTSPAPECTDDLLAQIKKLKTDIHDLQSKLSDGPAEDVQKKYTSQITAKQSLMADLQSKTTITIKSTIDPGYTEKKLEVDPDAPIKPLPDEPKPIAPDGLIASLTPSVAKVAELAGLDVKTLKPDVQQRLLDAVAVNVYLDFTQALPKISPGAGGLPPTRANSHDDAVTYREPVHIPVAIWHLLKGDDPKTGAALLAPPVSFPFAQFGSEQVLPLKAEAFKNLTWSVTFTELGEVTSATYTSKAWLASATQLFSSVASVSNGIATEVRAAAALTSPSAEASTLQSQADVIYQTHRLALCEADSLSCPGK